MITKQLQIFRGDITVLVKIHGEMIIDKPIYQKVLDGIVEYYYIICGDKIIDDFFLNKRENNKINLHISFLNFKECIDSAIEYLSSNYSYITFTTYEDQKGREMLDYLRNNYKVLSDSLKLYEMTELVIKTIKKEVHC